MHEAERTGPPENNANVGLAAPQGASGTAGSTAMPATRAGPATWWPAWLWLRRGQNAAGLAERLRLCAEALAGRVAVTEPDFFALGGDLRTLFESATELAQKVDETTARLHASLSSHRIGGEDGLVAVALRSIHAGVQDVDQELTVLKTIMTGLSAMHPQLARINRIGVLLQSAAVGFAVESARTAECQQAFGSFVDEIRGLARRITTIEEKVGGELTRARNEETQRFRELEAELGTMRELARQLEQTSEHAANEVQLGFDRTVALMDAARQRSARLRQHTEAAVYHVQFGDITRQKNEHIVTALQEVAATLQGKGKHSGIRKVATEADQTLAIQVGQMEVVGEELASARQQLEQSFAQIAGATAEFVALLQDREQAGASGESDRLRTLKADFDRLLELDEKGRSLRRRAAETAGHAYATAERLAAQMQEVQAINREMHLLALNAIVKTAALGHSGRTLEVLSMQVHELFREASGVVAGITEQTERLQKRDPQTADATGTAREDDVKLRLEDGVHQVRQAFEEFEQVVAEAIQRAGGQNDRLAEATNRLGALRAFTEHLQSLARDLGEVRAGLAPWCRQRSPTESLQEADLAARYTMQSEREVHLRIAAGHAAADTGGAALSPPEVAPVAVVAGRPAGVTAQEPPAPADTVPMTTAPTDGKDAGASLGDNVELF